MFNGAKTPDITAIQILAALTWVVSQAVAYGWLDHGPDQRTLSGAATVLAVGISWADSHLRGKRALAHAAINAPAPTATASGDGTATTVAVPPPTS